MSKPKNKIKILSNTEIPVSTYKSNKKNEYIPTGKPRGRPKKKTDDKIKMKPISRISSFNTLISDDADINLDIDHFIPITDKNTIPFKDIMPEMYRDSPAPKIFKGDVPDNEDMQKIVKDLEQKNQGWFGKRKEKGGSPKKKKNLSIKKVKNSIDDDFLNDEILNLDFKNNKKRNYQFHAEVPDHDEMKTIYKDLKSKGWFIKEYNNGGKSAKNNKNDNSKRKTKKVTFKKAKK